MRILLALALLAASASTWAGTDGYTFTVSPNPVPPGQAITVTATNATVHCFPLPVTMPFQDVGGGVIEFDLLVSDACFNAPPETRSYNIGTLPAGDYTFRFIGCAGNAPPGAPTPPCGEFGSVPVTVFGLSGTRFNIPMLSGSMMILLGFAVMVIGALAPRGR